jgi:hypothetical protein
LDREKGIVLIPCGHMCICEPCSRDNRIKRCPICMANISGKYRVYAGGDGRRGDGR